ncbi:MAG: hydrolase CocE/NonD family protein [Ferruginibacter sp.]|uniref:CocE/NonD family hydrolase n=1 Tax=Ferruginibacter sp. TaxID=1940288 RepID=UPI00265A78BD|nr:CocE/NonD family hydrolase [Ferruginibacter sp.]MDB5280308.1 hydrolase CocE/NonD family protein [Ferruginibacter sp.]
MKKWVFLFLVAGFSFSATAQNEDSSWFANNYYKIERMVPMRDGIRLFTAFYIPKDSAAQHPFLMTRTPYSCAPYGENKFSGLWRSYRMAYLKEKYIIVTQDVRGRYMSEGVFADVRPFNKNKKTKKDIDEASDTYDAIAWMLKNIPGNNGKVGVLGTSYPGFYATEAALSGHPALKAVSPQAPVTDWFIGDDFHHNGAFFALDGFSFYSSFGKPHPVPTKDYGPGFSTPVKDNYQFYLQAGAVKNLAAMIGDSIKFWHEMYKHPTYDAWWQARNARVGLYNVQPAMLYVGGLFDAEDCFGAWNCYKATRKQSPATNTKIVMGPWFHGQWSGEGSYMGNVRFASNTSAWYQQTMEVPFFNYYLKGIGNADTISQANIFFTGENSWKKLPQWPPANIENKALYFHAGGKLSFDKPVVKNAAFTEYTSDPAHPVPYADGVHEGRTREYMTDDQRFASRRPDVLSFETDTLTEELTLAGPVLADLMTSITTTDADFVVKVIDVFPDDFKYDPSLKGNGKDYPMGGYQMLVRAEIMRGKFRNSYENPEPFAPDKITEVKYALPDVAHTFKKGHRLMIQVQSTWFPLADRNPQKFINIYTANDSDFQKASIKIYHDGVNASSVLLPVLK